MQEQNTMKQRPQKHIVYLYILSHIRTRLPLLIHMWTCEHAACMTGILEPYVVWHKRALLNPGYTSITGCYMEADKLVKLLLWTWLFGNTVAKLGALYHTHQITESDCSQVIFSLWGIWKESCIFITITPKAEGIHLWDLSQPMSKL